MIKPFVKWAGGKTQILEKLLDFIPKKFNNYYEPFIGGGVHYFLVSCLEIFASMTLIKN
ncbi:DNA adenine methylase [Metamycoplasma hominis]|uniref:DNA adenine methylase n=1 Tax=Metamycoplasma hominis TaxID=2098 RepID=UPI001C68803D|nr:DNA adenine methylase [Metamycoplasma hominis]MDU7418798.1 DNA adenine methylase [Metamycoplasma hominis]